MKTAPAPYQPPVIPADDATAIRTEGLRKVYRRGQDGLVALEGLDLTVGRGEFFGLLGTNGAGKSTTIGMLTTLVTPTAGSAWVAGREVGADPVGVKSRIGVVPQANTLDRALSVQDNLAFRGRYFGMSASAARRRALELLEQFALSALLASTIGLLLGTAIDASAFGALLGLLLAAATMLGCVYYPWSALDPIGWVQVLTLADPLVYMSEGLRANLTPATGHMPTWAYLTALTVGTAALGWLALRRFTRRVQT
ncbi:MULTISPECIES: ATP-binding cassette domain-containing protein [Streptomyces]|uniref:ATP-binding cassette domain-containing protein n=1 Tax=Streptomyces TaxID=1883 RepID=UPI00069A2B7F|nr:ATP-binding cassette domain-containing protein [Streptomyces sp. SID7805]MYU55762.1 ATP-binding cassette domain-containing protein [Streptomyces sp. SID7805]